jgi:trigger factor
MVKARDFDRSIENDERTRPLRPTRRRKKPREDVMAENELEYQANVESISSVERKLDVEVPWDQVKGRLDEAYKELGRGVTVKGFRRGKVPRKMLERLFAQHVNKEVGQRLVQDSIAKVLTDKEITPVAEPEVDNNEGITNGEAFKYSATLQVVPEVEAKDYFGADVTQRPAKVDEAEVDGALEQRRQQLTEYKPIEGRGTELGDVLLVDLMGKLGDEPFDQENQLVELSEPPREPIPGLAAELTGKTFERDDEGEYGELDLELTVPGDEGAPPKTARLLVTVKDLKQKVVPELDDELAQNTGEAETLDELREKTRKQLLEGDEQRAAEEARQRLIDVVLEKNDVPVVPALVEQHLDRVIQMQAAMMGMDPNMFAGDETIKDRLREDAEKTVRGALLVGAIAKQEEVEVHDADLEKKLAEIASQRGENVAKVRSDYEKQGRLEQLRASLREEKTLDLLMSKANITIKETPEDEKTSDSSGATEGGDETPADGSKDTDAEASAE